MPEVLRFGISSLDELFGVPSETSDQGLPAGIYLPSPGDNITKAGAPPVAAPKGIPTTSVCIVGPTGTGKSIFALHMASTYLSDCRIEKGRSEQTGKDISLPTVLYVSTDLTHNMAQRAWSNFALDQPGQRREPFVPETRREEAEEIEIRLAECNPIRLAKQFDITQTEKSNVIFLDMAGYTAGDDWGFLHKILSLLPVPANNDPKHLVIIDAIEGFEALAGELNAFGEKSTRRSRIAQVMRLISGKCHVLLVVEQGDGGKPGTTLDEEFVADTVIRLDSISTRNYERRVLKVEKCRGQSHIRGQHHYSIRSGKGSNTGEQMNPDDPRIPAYSPPPAKTAATDATTTRGKRREKQIDDEEDSDSEPGDDRTQGYVQVFHSVHRISRKIMEDETENAGPSHPHLLNRYAAFGIKYLDNMLGGNTEVTKREKGEPRRQGHDELRFYYDTRGLPCGSTTALIGDSLTQKSTLGKAFLSRCFFSFDERVFSTWHAINRDHNKPAVADELWKRITQKILLTHKFDADTSDYCKRFLIAGKITELVESLEAVIGKYAIVPKAIALANPDSIPLWLTNLATWMLDYEGGVAVMLSTLNTDVDSLANSFIDWLHPDKDLSQQTVPGYRDALCRYIKGGTICRRLEIHSLSSEVLVHIVKQCINAAQRKIMTPLEIEDRNVRFRRSWPIRVVIDDFSSLRNMFPELREDPLLFPSILFHLEREGVTTLIIDTQSGKLETTVVERFETELRQMVQHRLYTWRVPFFGESRVAITAIPPLSHEYAGIVRELRWETEMPEGVSGEPAIVDPHFELYSGLEESKPEPVPLQVRLYVDTPAMEKYVEVENAFLSEMFSSYNRAEHSNNNSIIVGVAAGDYSDLRSFAYLQRDTRFDYSYVFEVDEFWLMRPPGRHKRAGAFQPQWSYLDAITADVGVNKARRAENFQANAHADPYELFQLRNQDPLPTLQESPSSQLRRRHFYKNYYEDFEGYDIFENGGSKEKFHLDRVPFSWDFGFLLCQQSAWIHNTRAIYQKLPTGVMKEISTVRDVWEALVKAQYDAPEPQAKNVSWRIFAEACKKAAEEQSAMLSKRVTAFDFAQVSPESFSCLILEMWLSQIYESLTTELQALQSRPDEPPHAEKIKKLSFEQDQLIAAVKKRKLFIPADPSDGSPEAYSLLTLLDRYWLELYITWLLLIEIIDFPTVIGNATVSTFDFQSKNTDFCAVASRHWYKTATQCPDEIAEREPLVPVRLPGHFAVRGDWFLAVSGGSRSIRQAERALDLLSSRRANVARLQMGVGLPTRVPRPDGKGGLFTKLISHERGQDNLEYQTFLNIAANNDKHFFWLWRSSLGGYAQCNRIWHRWLNRTLLWWHRKLLRYRSAWINSFNVCDLFLNDPEESRAKFTPTRIELDEMKAAGGESKELGKYIAAHSPAQLSIRVEFLELLDGLKEELRQVSVKSGT